MHMGIEREIEQESERECVCAHVCTCMRVCTVRVRVCADGGARAGRGCKVTGQHSEGVQRDIHINNNNNNNINSSIVVTTSTTDR